MTDARSRAIELVRIGGWSDELMKAGIKHADNTCNIKNDVFEYSQLIMDGILSEISGVPTETKILTLD